MLFIQHKKVPQRILAQHMQKGHSHGKHYVQGGPIDTEWNSPNVWKKTRCKLCLILIMADPEDFKVYGSLACKS